MQLTIHRPVASPVNRRHAQYVVGVLGLLIDVVGRKGLLATLLQQTRNEVLSLLENQPEEIKPSRVSRRKSA